ncbi:hypothetical protein ONS95_010472 [Cadophora gregata]|uniref:uncharacterized protein n=1 Tax=Cadophora gregata TaxID=51156 RepID=UPI0026DBA670|nr:uncharacterized protein ONS95_010472 [Cadophora gregata]KAK0122217.1 hypothetical protein ONS95_010472 [Cadophora gregata]
MSGTPLIQYTWIYQCRRCEKSLTKHHSSNDRLLAIDPNVPRGPCSCISLDEKQRTCSKEKLLDEPDDSPNWVYLCDCVREWTEQRSPGQSQISGEVCTTCYPQGMWELKRFFNSINPGMARVSNFQQDLSQPEVAASKIPSEWVLDNQLAQRQDCKPSGKSSIFRCLSNLKQRITHSDKQEGDDSNTSSSRVLRRPSLAHSLMDIEIPSHQIKVLISHLDPDDEDEDLEEARGFAAEGEDDSSSDDDDDDDEVLASLLTEVIERDDESSLFHSEGVTLVLENVPTDSNEENDSSLHILSQARTNCRRVNIWSPEEGDIRLDVNPRAVNSSNLRLVDTPSADSGMQASPSSTESRRPDNAARIQEVRNFFSIPESVPTSSIPYFIRGHSRVGMSLEYGIVLTCGGLTFRHRHPHIWLRSTQPGRLAEFNEVLNSDDIVWEDDIRREVSDSDIVRYDARIANTASGSVTLDSRFDFTRLDGDDETEFWSAVGVSEGERSRLVAEEQEPRLHTDPDSACAAWEASDLILEINVQPHELHERVPIFEDERDDIEEDLSF